MISGIYVVNAAGLKLYSKVYDSKFDVDDMILMSFLSAIQMYAKVTIDETIQTIELEGIYVIYRIPSKRVLEGIMIVIVAQMINPVILLKAGYIIDLLRKEFAEHDDFDSTILFLDKYTDEIRVLEKKIDEIIKLSNTELEAISTDAHVIRLEKILAALSKRVPIKTLQISPKILLIDKLNFKVDPSITQEEALALEGKLRNVINRIFGNKVFEETTAKI